MATVSVLAAMLVLPLLFVVPGWLILRRTGVGPLQALYGGLGVGCACAAAVVGLGVALPWSVRTTCVVALAVLLAISVWCARTAPRPLLPERVDLVGLGVFFAAYLAASSFVALPSRPFGNWGPFTVGPGRVTSPRWPGQPVDNVIPYRTGQVAFYKEASQLRDRFAVGWWLSDRTPLVGLDFAFGVGALDIHMRNTDPTLDSGPAGRMQVKDPYAFWFYNFVSILLSSAVVLGVFMLARAWRGDHRLAVTAALVAALLPGFFLNEIYTWPKLATAYFVLAAAAFALERRAMCAGFFAGLAYLVHPVAVFYLLPVALLLLFGTQRQVRWRSALARLLSAALVVALPWQLFTSLKLHAISKLALWPLGGFTELRTHPFQALSQAWDAFVARGLLVDVWARISSTAFSLLPTDLGSTPTTNTQVYPQWSNAHGMSIWGVVGVVLFPAIVIWLARNWRAERRMFALLVVPYVMLAILASGSPSYGDGWAHQSAYGVIGVVCIWAAAMLRGASEKVRSLLVAAFAFELLTVAYAADYRPYNADQATTVLFAVLAIGAHIALFAALIYVLDLRISRPKRTRRPELAAT